jgi:DNA polymerase III delta subunit
MRSTGAAALLKEITAQKTCPGCVVITCPDWIRRDRALSYVVEHFAGPRYQPRSFTFGEAGRNSITHFLNDIGAPSLFESQKFGVLRAVENARVSDLEPISAFIAKQPLGVHLIAVGTSLPNSPNFKKALDKHATLVAFEPLKGAELRRWTERELRHHDISEASDEVVEAILSLASEEPEAITRLIEKFTLYLNGEPPSTEALHALIPGRSHASDFELSDHILTGKRAVTEVLLQQLLSQGSSPFMLIGLLTKTFTNLLRVRAMLDRGYQQQDIRNELGVSSWLFNKYLPTAKRLSSSQISRTLEALLVSDYRMKDRSLGPGAVFSTVIYEASRND